MQNNLKMRMLQGADRVRKRPAVIFGSSDVDGAIVAVNSILEIFANEAALGYSKKLSITLHRDTSISIHSFDRGFYIDETVVDGTPIWQQYFCAMYPGPRNTEGDGFILQGRLHYELYGEYSTPPLSCIANRTIMYGIYCVHCVCDFMRVEAVRDGKKKTLCFSKGECVGGVLTEQTDEPTGTLIHLRLDDKVFDSVDIPAEVFEKALYDLSLTVPGLQCEFVDERIMLTRTHEFTYGIYTYAQQFCDFLPYKAEKEACGRDRYNQGEYDAHVRVAIGFTSGQGIVRCFHNLRDMKYGGLHLEKAQQEIVNCFTWEFKNEHQGIKCYKDLAKHMVLLVETRCSPIATRWQNGTRTSITNRMITDITQDLIADKFSRYLHEHHNEVLAVIQDQ